jgi:shikimate dehydrogenase
MKSVKVFMLIGDPVEGTLSPAMLNAAFNALELNSTYVAVRVPGRLLADAIGGIRAMDISGFNVTVPHKISVMNFLDELDKSAEEAGAVNTVKNQRGKLVGFNTDGEGALRALREKIGGMRGKKVVLLGAGGAARAIAFSLAKAGAELTIANRTLPRAEALASMIKQKLDIDVAAIPLNRTQLASALRDADILINATSVGMYPKAGQTLVTSEMMHKGLVVNDIVYKPPQTRLLREARLAGADTIDGLGMLLQQASLSFEIWTGRKAPIRVMKSAMESELRRRSR